MTLVTTEWLGERLGQDDIRIADASWYLPEAKRNARAEYEQRHIPGAVFFDIDAISDPATSLPHMLPEPALFSAAMRRLGIGDSDFVVFYDGAGIYSAPRALWMMRAMGSSLSDLASHTCFCWVSTISPPSCPRLARASTS